MDKKLKYMFKCGIGKSLWLAVLVLLSAQGCCTIDDNTDDCFPLARLRFSYAYNMSGNDRFRDQVSTIDLYVYNQSDGSLVATKRYSQAELASENYSVALRWLRQGDYYIIALGNKNDVYYSCQDHGCMDDMRVRMLCSDGAGNVTANPGSFFYGMVELAKTDTDEKVVGMIKNTNDINITVRNQIPTRAGGVGLPDLGVRISVHNGTIKYDNSIAMEDTRVMTHISNNAFPEYQQEFRTTLTVGRLFSTDGSVITITNSETGDVLSTDNLTEKIVKLLTENEYYDGMDPDEYLDRQDNYDLVYVVEMKYGVVVTTLVTLNDWRTSDNNSGGV